MRVTPMAPESIYDRSIPEPNSGCWLWLGGTVGKGYGQVSAGGRSWVAHRLSFTIFRGPISDGAVLLHTCDTPPCVNPDHLEPGTVAQNNQDRAQKARSACGERCGSSRLTWPAVRAIRASALGDRELGRQHRVSHRTIAAIRRGDTWKE